MCRNDFLWLIVIESLTENKEILNNTAIWLFWQLYCLLCNENLNDKYNVIPLEDGQKNIFFSQIYLVSIS